MNVSRRFILIVIVMSMLFALGGCRSEAQNRWRRNIQDYTGQDVFINLYALDGTVIYSGRVDGKVTRASASLSNSSDSAAGSYIFWYDNKGVYHQSDLHYLITGKPLEELQTQQ